MAFTLGSRRMCKPGSQHWYSAWKRKYHDTKLLGRSDGRGTSHHHVDGVFAGTDARTGKFSLIAGRRRIRAGKEAEPFREVTISGDFLKYSTRCGRSVMSLCDRSGSGKRTGSRSYDRRADRIGNIKKIEEETGHGTVYRTIFIMDIRKIAGADCHRQPIRIYHRVSAYLMEEQFYHFQYNAGFHLRCLPLSLNDSILSD